MAYLKSIGLGNLPEPHKIFSSFLTLLVIMLSMIVLMLLIRLLLENFNHTPLLHKGQ